jgi:hypothetical protein
MQVTDEPVPVSKRLPPGRTLPKGYEAVVVKCLAKDPQERFASMSDVQAALERIAEGGVPLVMPPKRSDGEEDASDSVIKDLKADTDYQELRRGARRRKASIWAASLAVAGVTGYAGWRYVGPLLPKPNLPTIVIVPAAPEPSDTTVAAPPPPAPAPAPTPAPVAEAPAAPETRKVALILFPLDSHAYDGKTDLGMMPVTLELKPGESKTIDVRRKMFVPRTVRIDGTKPRVVIGLVSTAVAARRKGISQAEQEAAADRAAEVQAEKVVLDEDDEPGSIPEVVEPTAKNRRAQGSVGAPPADDEPANP